MKSIPVRKIKERSRLEAPMSGIRVRSIKDILSDEQQNMDVHRHEFYFVLVVESGSGAHEIDFMHYDVQDRCVFILRPGQVHLLSLDSGTSGYVIQFTNDFLLQQKCLSRPLYRRVSQRTHATIRASTLASLRRSVRDIEYELSKGLVGYEESIGAHFTLFMTALARDSFVPVTSASNPSLTSLELFEELSELIERNMVECKRPSEYAELLHVSLYQLNATTKAMVGKSCSELINEFVIIEAKRLLIATASQVKEISYQLGYDDPSYFIRFFRKQTGHTPDGFRIKAR